MIRQISTTPRRRLGRAIAIAPLTLLFLAPGTWSAWAAEAPVDLGLIGSYAVLGGSTVTNEGATVVTGNVGVSPGSAITGFPPGIVLAGVQHAADTEAAAARAAFTTAYNDAAGRSPVEVGMVELANRTLVAGVYSGGALELNGTLTLNGDASSVFIFQATSSLITASGARVQLSPGVSPCNVFWQVASSATLGSGTTFVGTILAGASITADSTTNVLGRLIAGTGQVELHNNVVVRPSGCSTLAGDTDGNGVVDDADDVVIPTGTPTDGDLDGDSDVDADDAAISERIAAAVAAAAAPAPAVPPAPAAEVVVTAPPAAPILPATGPDVAPLVLLALLLGLTGLALTRTPTSRKPTS